MFGLVRQWGSESPGDADRLLTHPDESSKLCKMTKRLQVLFDDEELAEIQRLAKRQRKTTAEWVRDALRAAQNRESYPEAEPKLRAVREALTYGYPTGDIDTLLEQIEHGYLGEGKASRR
jgi:hypothetical protein